jgi:hypothetical protein
MPDDTRAALQELCCQLFPTRRPDPAPTRPPHLVVPHEGQPVGPGTISAEQRFRDYTRRLFDADYRAHQQPLPD